MWNKIKSLSISDKIILFCFALFSIATSVSAITAPNFTSNSSSQKEVPTCDGIEVTADCQDENGTLYSKYIYHEAVEEVTETIKHPAEPAKTHEVYHEAVYGARQVQDCIRTSISYKSGSCALSRCRDGSYSGSTGRGTCSYHGGVAQSGGPWYIYRTETYVITPAWIETVVDKPAKDAWTETKIIVPAKEAYYEKEILK